MDLRRIVVAAGMIMTFGASWAKADLVYTCDASINDPTQGGMANTCSYLNSVVAGVYNSTFSNINANIYIQMGITGLGQGEAANNNVTYSQYVAALAANAAASGNAVQLSAVNALNSVDSATYYAGGTVEITNALGAALGFSGLSGFQTNGDYCLLGSAGCYNDVLTITTPANLYSETTNCPGPSCDPSAAQGLYWDQNGGAIPSNDYDFYSVVEHETDEALGTSSCITTQTTPLSSNCDYGAPNFAPSGANAPSAADLFRYSAPGSLVLNSSLSTTPGAYFSYDGGVTNGANGAIYNTLDNGDDYGDYASNCQFVQDATGCLGQALSIATDGGEINILNAEGYNLASSTPEPGTIALVCLGGSALAVYRRRRRVPQRS